MNVLRPRPMGRFFVALSVCAPLSAAAGATGPTLPLTGPDRAGGYASDHVIVQVKPGIVLPLGSTTLSAEASGRAMPEPVAATLTKFAVSRVDLSMSPPPADKALAKGLGLDRYYTLHVPVGTNTIALAAELSGHTEFIETAEVDGIGSWDAVLPANQQWSMLNIGQVICSAPGVTGADIQVVDAWALATGSPGVTVAILDTGISQSHPNLAPSLVPGRNFVPGSQPDLTDDTATGFPHGTVCAGIAAGARVKTNSFLGVAFGCRLMPVVVGNAAFLDESWAASGLIWAADQGVHVASMSFSTPTGTTFFSQAVKYAYNRGVVLCASSGNLAGTSVQYPARWPSVICVGATDNTDQLATFSTTGSQVDVSAPGFRIWSTWDSTASPECVAGGYNTFGYASGTSFAVPHVAGLAALVKSANPTLSGARIRQIIETTADDRGTPGWDPSFGFGRINAMRAVRAALNLSRCPADWTNDGRVDASDIAVFTTDWLNDIATGGLRTDVDHSGVVDVTDISRLIAMWFDSLNNGC
ncbi:MAG: S8 family serine peptidase [Phycisphaeraceae bacterium]|nr:S8 family serine peptidase [Phycisphaeraceae bacterium]